MGTGLASYRLVCRVGFVCAIIEPGISKIIMYTVGRRERDERQMFDTSGRFSDKACLAAYIFVDISYRIYFGVFTFYLP